MMEILKKKGLFMSSSVSSAVIVLDIPLVSTKDDILLHTTTENDVIYYPDGVLLDESGDYVQVTDNATLSFTNGSLDNPFSIALEFIKLNVQSTASSLICKWDSTSLREYQLYFDTSGNIVFKLWDDTGGGYKQAITNSVPSIVLGINNSLIATYNGTNGLVLVLNGVILATTYSTSGSYTCMRDITANVTIGKLSSTSTPTLSTFIGSIKNVKIYSGVLSATQIEDLQPINTIEDSTTKLYIPYYGNIYDKANTPHTLTFGGTGYDYLTKPRWLTSGTTVYQQITSGLDDLTFYSGTTDLAFSWSEKYTFSSNSNVSWFNKSNGSAIEYSIKYDTTLGIVITLRDNANNAEWVYTKSFTPILSSNYAFAISYNGSPSIGNLKLYINGQLQTATTEVFPSYVSMSSASGGTQQVNVTVPQDRTNQIAYFPGVSSIIDVAKNHSTVGMTSTSDGMLLSEGGTYLSHASDLSFTDGITDLPFSISVQLAITTGSNMIIRDNVVLVKANGLTGTAPTLNIEGSNIEYILIRRKVANLMCFVLRDEQSNYLGVSIPMTAITNTTLTIGVTYDGSKTNEGMSMYLNGVKQVTSNYNLGTYTGMTLTSNRNLWFGRDPINYYGLYGRATNLHIDKICNSGSKMLEYHNEQKLTLSNAYGTLNGSIKNLKVESIAIPQSTVVKYANDAESYRVLDMQFNKPLDDNTKNGFLYNWHAVNTGKLAPIGWHVATDAEFTTLSNYVTANLGYSSTIGKALASETTWTSYATVGTVGNDFPTNNSSGFSAVGGGILTTGFLGLGTYGRFWTSTSSSASNSYYRYMNNNLSTFTRDNVTIKYGMSVRCIKDNNTPTVGGFTYDGDGNRYTEVVIGTQIWMIQNLATTKYNDGTSISNVTDGTTWINLTSGAYCAYNNDNSNAFKLPNSNDYLGHTVTDTAMTYSNNQAVFNGSTSKITIANSSDLSFTTGTKNLTFTIDIRFTVNVLNNFFLVGKLNSVNAWTDVEWSISRDNTDLFFRVGDTTNNTGTYYNFAFTPTIGVAYRITGTYCNETLGHKVYVNGVLQGVGVTPISSVIMRNNNFPVSLGKCPTMGSLAAFNGTIDYCTIYNRVLIQDEIVNGIQNVYDEALNLIQNSATTFDWWDFTDVSTVTKDGSNFISSVVGKTSSRSLAQPTAARKPTWSSNGILFDGAVGIDGDHLQYQLPSGTMSSQLSIYMVVKQVSWKSAGTLFTMGTPYQFRQLGVTPQIKQVGNAVGTPDSNLTIGTHQVVTVSFNTSNSYVKVGSSNKTISSNLTSFTPNTFRLGAYPGIDSAECYAGNIEVKELIIRTVADTDADALTIQNYLKNKYNL